MRRTPRFFVLPLALLTAAALCLPARSQNWPATVPPPPTSLPSPLTLGQAIAIALGHQPQQYVARAQVTQALGQRQQANAEYFPTFTPSYQYQSRRQNLYGVNAGTISGGTTGTGGTTVPAVNEVSVVRGGGLALSLSQTLLDNGAREASNAQARRALDAAHFGITDTRQATILTVTQDYYQLLAAIDLVKVAQAQVTRFQQTLDVTQAQIQAGTVAGKEQFQAQADLASAQVTLLQDQTQVTTASATLKNAMGVETDSLVQPAGLASTTDLPPLPAASTNTPLDTYLQIAYVSRPDLRQQQATAQSSLSALQAAQKRAGFTLSADYVLTYQATNDVGNRGTDSQILLTGSYPLFDAGSARGAVRVAQGQLDAARAQLESARQQVHLDVEQAYATRTQNLAATRLAQAAVTAAQVNYDAALAARREGVGTLLDITTAQATLTQAQNQYVAAVYNFYIADAQLARAVGRNDTAAP